MNVHNKLTEVPSPHPVHLTLTGSIRTIEITRSTCRLVNYSRWLGRERERQRVSEWVGD